MNPQSATIAGSGNPLKSRFESEIRAKIYFLKSAANPFAYSPAPWARFPCIYVKARQIHVMYA